ncbi:uncharacterized protein LOC110254832 [Exaiptasia diaphana]|uniref:Uncharacterized protein n=1 Tax=Exaiptasia diaphana TaxID=2652724 RepID=A0A913YC93_EXADI|nr:uncharacterized protein LOC110254832 [Exaiptasia diaphana]
MPSHKVRFLLLFLVSTMILQQITVVRASAWVKMNRRLVCFGARGNQYGSFQNYAKEGKVSAIKLVYHHGYVRCARKAVYHSRWGCGGRFRNIVNVIATDEHNRILFPRKDLYYSKYKSGLWYTLPFADGVRSKELVFLQENFVRPFYFPLERQMRIWYGEDLANSSEKDNAGRVCVNVYAKFTTL